MKRELKNEQGETVLLIELPETATEADYEKAVQGMGYNLDGSIYKKPIFEPTPELKLSNEEILAEIEKLKAMLNGN